MTDKTKETDATQFALLACNVRDRQAEYYKMCQARDNVVREVTAALNLLNESQKAFDAATMELRKTAPRDSEWRRPENLGRETKSPPYGI